MKIFKRWAAEYWIENHQKQEAVKDLNFEFVDSTGKKYYSWEFHNVPTNRLNQVIGFSMWGDAKIGPETLETISDAINNENMDIARGGARPEMNKKHARISVLCDELKTRQKYAIPNEIVLNMTAALCVREDENPNEFSSVVHDEKVNQFKLEQSKGNTFFLKLSTLKKLLNRLIGTDENVTALLLKWEQDKLRQSERLKTILSNTESKNTTKKSAK